MFFLHGDHARKRNRNDDEITPTRSDRVAAAELRGMVCSAFEYINDNAAGRLQPG